MRTRKPSRSLIASNRRISGREQYQAERTEDSSMLTSDYSVKGEFISKSTVDGHLYPGRKRSPKSRAKLSYVVAGRDATSAHMSSANRPFMSSRGNASNTCAIWDAGSDS